MEAEGTKEQGEAQKSDDLGQTENSGEAQAEAQTEVGKAEAAENEAKGESEAGKEEAAGNEAKGESEAGKEEAAGNEAKGESEAGKAEAAGNEAKGESEAGKEEAAGNEAKGESEAGKAEAAGNEAKGESEAGKAEAAGNEAKGESEAGKAEAAGNEAKGESEAGKAEAAGNEVKGEGEAGKIEAAGGDVKRENEPTGKALGDEEGQEPEITEKVKGEREISQGGQAEIEDKVAVGVSGTEPKEEAYRNLEELQKEEAADTLENNSSILRSEGRTGSTSDEPLSPEPGDEEEYWPEFSANSPEEGPESPTGFKSLEKGGTTSGTTAAETATGNTTSTEAASQGNQEQHPAAEGTAPAKEKKKRPVFDRRELTRPRMPPRAQSRKAIVEKFGGKLADCAQLLDVEDMVHMSVPDAKCIYTYIQELYRSLVQKGLVKTKKQ
ncbi:smoothelin-like protein 1 isoform X2 [Eublepharis macularius]|uniref:Smoothelin-like protein 1 isoform X2 n=1 Tax=Eublepharis macularius TaxID=481883 RepID=A0AA97IVQ8_EUBMA|nr:smoothelin-like protein 1 isoform X2 [Eublepharis macularius]